MSFLNNIRRVNKQIPLNKKNFYSIAILLLGIVLGIVSKFLDTTPSNELPFIIESLYFRNFFWTPCNLDIDCCLYLNLQQFFHQSIHKCICIFCWDDYKLLFIFKVYSWIFPEKLCDDLVWDCSNFPLACFCLLVCKGERQNISCPFRNYNSSFIQYDICLWMDLFRHLFHLRSDSFYLRISNFKT